MGRNNFLYLKNIFFNKESFFFEKNKILTSTGSHIEKEIKNVFSFSISQILTAEKKYSTESDEFQMLEECGKYELLK